ncbi:MULTISPECIES: carboxymuconolactone decarboxylase family protein [unclassified Streptomyces]|uniref:carboxymuconolactone decarboxylase family protein n=1 Tax=unclassified Streptomyces TaxID=2593676 RepID=UPI003798F7EE
MTSPFRFTSPGPVGTGNETVAAVHAQVTRDFGIEGALPFVVLSAAPDLMAAAWALMRESLLSGRASRTEKELVAYGVSLANRCPFCVGAHTLLLYAGGDLEPAGALARGERPGDPRHEHLLSWGQDMRGPAPFAVDAAPEFVGSALAFHFINRIVSALIDEESVSGGADPAELLDSAAGRALVRAVRGRPEPGLSLPLLGAGGPPPGWAAGTPVGTAFGALRSAAHAGAGLLAEGDAALVREAVAAWDGFTPLPLSGDGLPDRAERPGARLALLAARAPYRITAEDVQAWRVPPFTDHCLVHLVAFGAMLAVERVEAGMGGAARG